MSDTTTSPTDQPATGDVSPGLVAVEDGKYVFVGVLEDARVDDTSNWLCQRLRVDPTAGGDSELVVTVTERYHADGRIAFRQRFTTTVPLDVAATRPGIRTVQRALDRWCWAEYHATGA